MNQINKTQINISTSTIWFFLSLNLCTLYVLPVIDSVNFWWSEPAARHRFRLMFGRDSSRAHDVIFIRTNTCTQGRFWSVAWDIFVVGDPPRIKADVILQSTEVYMQLEKLQHGGMNLTNNRCDKKCQKIAFFNPVIEFYQKFEINLKFDYLSLE